MLPSTTDRVPQNTTERINEQIRQETQQNAARVAAGGRLAIERRLRELDQEWDIERTIEANAASAVLIGVGLGTFVNRKLFALPAVIAGFLLQHALQGWCPPVPIFRRLGFRTQTEIDEERYALKAMRGDFEHVSEVSRQNGRPSAVAALAAVRR